ncbi:MAG: type II secretion system F family protein [Thermoplasmatota archaeon]
MLKHEKNTQAKQQKERKNKLQELKNVFAHIDDKQKYLRTVLLPLLILSGIISILPFLLSGIGFPISFINPLTFVIGGLILGTLGIFYPLISWKNKEADINGKIHFFITHLRVLVISDLSLKEIIKVLGGNKAYGALGEEMRKISVLSDQWRLPLSKSFLFLSKRTPSKILKDFLDRFSQSLNSGVDPREFIETEQGAVLQEYKTMYETSNDNITILNEVYVSLLISIIFIMSLGIVLPIVMGGDDMNTFVYLSSFLLIISEGLLLYLLRSMIPPDEIWHVTGEKGKQEIEIHQLFYTTLCISIALGIILFSGKYLGFIPFFIDIPNELLVACSLTPLILPGVKSFKIEREMTRKERNFLSFLPALGSISTMRGGKINESIYYLSEKDYGVLTSHIKDLYKRLRTRINDDNSWEWFGVDTGSNYIQRSSEMFRQATASSANPQKASRMIAENIRKIRDLRVKKLAIVNTSAALFAGITFGIAFSAYTSLVISEHLNSILLEGMSGDPFAGSNIDIGTILNAVQPETFTTTFTIIFLVMVIHSFILSFTIRTLRGSHKMVTLLYFVPFVWIVTITAVGISMMLGEYLGM